MKRMGSFIGIVTILVAGLLLSFSNKVSGYRPPVILGDTVLYPDEHHFKNIQQLTFGGDNAEAYFSADSKYLIFQRTNPKEELTCDQEFIGKVPVAGEKFTYRMVSSGKGRTTCGFFAKDGRHII